MRLVLTTSSHSSSLMRRIRLSRVMPALLTRMSIRPRSLATPSIMAVTAAKSARSHARAVAFPPALVIDPPERCEISAPPRAR